MVLEGVMARTKNTGVSSADRLLEVTERLCATFGLEAVSVRDIAKEAKISLSVIYHHFGSKSGLIKAVMALRMRELYEVRRPLFTELETETKPDLEKLLYAVIAPLALLRTKGRQGEITGLFLARLLMSPLPEIKAEIDQGVGELKYVVDLAHRAAPHLSREEICWRLHFTIGLEHMTHWDYDRLEIMSEGLCSAQDVEKSISRAVSFAKTAFLAP
jgi:AcrR family transcriptional regulator